MPKASASGWGRAGHRRAVLIGAVVVAILVGGGVTAWAEVSGGSTGYRMATVTRATIGTTLPVVGNVDPVSDAAASFQVGGQVATLTATPGEAVTAGQTLGTLDTTALSESVSSAQSTLNAAEAKLVEDEENQAGAAAAAAAAAASAASKSAASTTTTTTTPTNRGTDATVTQDQTTLTQDESTLSTDQQKEGADLKQSQSACQSANTSTPAGQTACEAALQTVSTDEQVVSKDQAAVSKDETALGQALGAESSGGTGTGGGATGTSGTSPTQSGHAQTTSSDATGNTGSAGTGSATNGSGGSTNTDTPEQIASDQAAIDSAEADLTNAQQALNAATLASPIDGTIVSVDIAVGETVSANSSTEIITIIGTNAYEVQATLDSSQIPSVKVGQSATVEVDGVNGSIAGTVAQVGPVQSGASGFTYPVVVALPASTSGLFAGSTANVTIATGTVSNVIAVPTSALQTLATRAYVLELSKGQLTRKVVKVGMVGSVYTQVLSGLTPGQSVVLADYAEPVPSSNTATLGGIGGFGGGGGGFFGGGGAGTFRFQRGAGGGGGAVSNVAVGR